MKASNQFMCKNSS